jgi:hypothetical protein
VAPIAALPFARNFCVSPNNFHNFSSSDCKPLKVSHHLLGGGGIQRRSRTAGWERTTYRAPRLASGARENSMPGSLIEME